MVGAIASAIGTGAQTLLGIGQTIGGLFMPKPEIPEYEIPQELYENMTDAEYWSFVGLPEAQKQQFIEGSMRAGASALSASADRKGGLGLVSSIAQQQQDASMQLLSADSQARMANIQRFWDARGKVAGAKDVKYQADLGKALQQRQERMNMIGAGMQNIAGGVGTFAGLANESDAETWGEFFNTKKYQASLG